MEEGEDRGLSIGEMLVEVAGVESAVARRRRAVSDGRAVEGMAEVAQGAVKPGASSEVNSVGVERV